MSSQRKVSTLKAPSKNMAMFLFAIVIASWGTMWVVIKVIVEEISPLWAIAIRNGAAAVGLSFVLLLTGRFIVPRRGDWPIVLVISLFHMTAFAVLMTIGLKYVPVGRSVVLGYTTPLWVAPAAWLLLKEPMPGRRIVGVVIGLVGTCLLFNPASFDWHNTHAVFGNALLLIAALCWSVSILYTRVHRWVSTPIQLVPWQALISSIVLAVLATALEGWPHIPPSFKLISAFGYCSIVGVVIAYWAMTIVNSSLPATTTSLGVLATPIVGIVVSALALGERIDTGLLVSAAMIIAGIALGTTAGSGKRAVIAPAPAPADASK
ncbi:DMT family transporter [Paraburkholderia bannensis]|uniref:DMT family transporter n=1 Tax=Paraburkholderia bannensis TaxID=765414 RepID=UPI002ABE8516|nr:DMT family transporter [Paraburkholderia bannensis]